MHGDPIFKKGGVGLQFSIPLGRPAELLTWVGRHGETVVLSGTTFENKETENQWFNSFAMAVDGRDVFNVSTAKVQKGTLKVVVDGLVVVIPSDVTNITSSRHADTSLTLSSLTGKKFKIGHKSAQTLQVRTGHVSFSVFSSGARKFDDKEDQFKYRHLNIHLGSGIPPGSRGIFAELAGAQPMSANTREMLHKPQLFDKLMKKERYDRAARQSRRKAMRKGGKKEALEPEKPQPFETVG